MFHGSPHVVSNNRVCEHGGASANAALIEVGSRRTGRVQRRGSAVGAEGEGVRASGACGTGRPLLTCTPMRVGDAAPPAGK
ncbi:hypothetical protein AB691_4365 [Stutzerimonas stutzeri]|nr:hypothetical protein AB691_4365 [Stutzerimonas stutzeri]